MDALHLRTEAGPQMQRAGWHVFFCPAHLSGQEGGGSLRLPKFFRHGRRRGRLPGGKGCLLKGPRVMPYHINKARAGKPVFAGAIRPRPRSSVSTLTIPGVRRAAEATNILEV